MYIYIIVIFRACNHLTSLVSRTFPRSLRYIGIKREEGNLKWRYTVTLVLYIYVWRHVCHGLLCVARLGTVCVSLFYVNDIGSTGSRGRTRGFPVYTLHLNSDAGYAVVPLTLLGSGRICVLGWRQAQSRC